MKYFGLLIVILASCLYSCSNHNSATHSVGRSATAASDSSPFIKEYAGGYMIEVNDAPSNQNAEGYALRTDGTAKWMWIINDGSGGANIQSEKSGTWTASDGRIIVSINGNSGM